MTDKQKVKELVERVAQFIADHYYPEYGEEGIVECSVNESSSRKLCFSGARQLLKQEGLALIIKRRKYNYLNLKKRYFTTTDVIPLKPILEEMESEE